MSRDDADALLGELLAIWRGDAHRGVDPSDWPPAAIAPAVPSPSSAPSVTPHTHATSLGAELGEQLVSEVLRGVRAGRQGVYISEPERLRTAIFIRGYSLGDFARLAGMAPSTLSRALAGQPVAPSSWRALITTLDRA